MRRATPAASVESNKNSTSIHLSIRAGATPHHSRHVLAGVAIGRARRKVEAMNVTHPKILIEIEGDTERRFLNMALCAACELAHESIRNRKVSSILIRAGCDPLELREVDSMRDVAETLLYSL